MFYRRPQLNRSERREESRVIFTLVHVGKRALTSVKLLRLTASFKEDKRVHDLVESHRYRHLIGIAQELACRRRGTIYRKAHCERAVASSRRRLMKFVTGQHY